MQRVDPNQWAADRKEAMEKSRALRNQLIEKEMENATFQPTIHTKRAKDSRKESSVKAIPLADQVAEQMAKQDIMEAPLPATLKRLGSHNTLPAHNQNRKDSTLDKENMSNVQNTENGNVVNKKLTEMTGYVPTDYDSLDLSGKTFKDLNSLKAEATFLNSLRPTVNTASNNQTDYDNNNNNQVNTNYDLDAVVPSGYASSSDNNHNPQQQMTQSIRSKNMPKRRERRATFSDIPSAATAVAIESQNENEDANANVDVNADEMVMNNMMETACVQNTSKTENVRSSRLSLLKAKVSRRSKKLNTQLLQRSETAGAKTRSPVEMVTCKDRPLTTSQSESSFLMQTVPASHDNEQVVDEYNLNKGKGNVKGNAVLVVGSRRASKSRVQIQKLDLGPDNTMFDPSTGEPIKSDSPKYQNRVSSKPENEVVTHTPVVQQSIEIRTRTLAEASQSTTPSIYTDLPEEAFSNDSDHMENTMMACPHCDRKFSKVAGERHVKVCQQVFCTKPQVFNSRKMRVEHVFKENKVDATHLLKEVDIEASPKPMKSKFVPRLSRKKMEEVKCTTPTRKSVDSNTKTSKSAKWRKQSMALRDALKVAKNTPRKGVADSEVVLEGDPQQTTDGAEQNVVVESRKIEDDLVSCPHCSRRFNEKAANRHIPICTTIQAKPKTLRAKSGHMAVASAKPKIEKKIVTRIF